MSILADKKGNYRLRSIYSEAKPNTLNIEPLPVNQQSAAEHLLLETLITSPGLLAGLEVQFLAAANPSNNTILFLVIVFDVSD